ncbi:MAG: hypothetical protein ACUVS1_00550 [Actinomycetota bacterium]
MKVDNSGARGWKIVALTCVGLLIAGLAFVIIWAVASGGEGGDEASLKSGVVSKENAQDRAQSSDAGEKEPKEERDDTGEGKKGDAQQADTSGTKQNEGMQILPVPASSVDEALLNQAAMDYLMNTVGTTQGYDVGPIVISAIDSRWARVVIVQEQGNIRLGRLVYFYYQGGKWIPAPTGPGSPARPTDI